MRPTRTHSYPDLLIPRRTSISSNLRPYEYNLDLSTTTDLINQTLSSTVNFHEMSIDNFIPTKRTSLGPHREKEIRKSNAKKINVDKESNLSYNELFYNEDDSESESSTKRKEDKISTDYVDNAHNDTETDSPQVNYDDAIDIDNTTESSIDEFTSEITTNGLISKNMTKIRRNFLCNILKINPLTFNSARTLHEVFVYFFSFISHSPG